MTACLHPVVVGGQVADHQRGEDQARICPARLTPSAKGLEEGSVPSGVNSICNQMLFVQSDPVPPDNSPGCVALGIMQTEPQMPDSKARLTELP